MMRKIKVAITGGHLTCALATISALRKNDSGIEIVFFGRKHSMEGDASFSAEYKIIPKMGIKFLSIESGRIQRRFTKYTLSSLTKIPWGFLQSFYYIAREKPDVICSFGGYLSSPVVFAGWLFGIPSITHEQSVIPGLACKFNSLFVNKIAISWPQTRKYLKNNKVVLTGNPIRKEVFAVNPSDPKLKKFLDFASHSKRHPLIYVTGGNQGSHFLNNTIKNILPKLLENYFVIHQTGDSKIYHDYEDLVTSYKSQVLGGRYFVTKYIDSVDVGAVLNKADLVVSRAGANTVTELLALGKPAILIPLPWSGGKEQQENARIIQEVGIGQVLLQENLTPYSLVQSIDNAIANLKNFKKNVLKAKMLVKLDAAERLANEILNLVK